MTHDFKEGDECWYFDFPQDGCNGDISAIKLCVNKGLQKYELTNGYLDYVYKSKYDAVEAMIEKMEEIIEQYPG